MLANKTEIGQHAIPGFLNMKLKTGKVSKVITHFPILHQNLIDTFLRSLLISRLISLRQ